MMDELISRAAAIEAIKPLLYNGNFISVLLHLPAVDAVPVIRCKDCKYWGVVDSYNWMTCRKGILTGWSNKGYGYCSYGERKSNIEGN